MVTLPPEFTATRYPGYFWNIKTQKLFSLKVSGELRELKLIRPNHWNGWKDPGYRVSHEGVRKVMSLPYLQTLKLKDSKIKIKKQF